MPTSRSAACDRPAGDAAVFVADGGDFVATASYILRPRGPLSWLDPGAFAPDVLAVVEPKVARHARQQHAVRFAQRIAPRLR